MRIALKIDVCTRAGLLAGAPRLLDLLARLGVRASFFVAFGPDRSGRAVLKLLDPQFRRKVLRTRALRLYGWRTALSGTLLPARRIGAGSPEAVRRIREAGHEVGLHGWDHRLWQDRMARLGPGEARAEVERAFEAFAEVLGEPARAFAAPAWTASPAALRALAGRSLEYTSNTRGGRPFRPVVEGEPLPLLEVPSTLPCPEEVLAAEPRADPYGDNLLPLEAGGHEVFPAHAEVEGHPDLLPAFERWLRRRRAEGAELTTLAEAARAAREAVEEPPARPLTLVKVPGRAGTVLTGWPEGTSP